MGMDDGILHIKYKKLKVYKSKYKKLKVYKSLPVCFSLNNNVIKFLNLLFIYPVSIQHTFDVTDHAPMTSTFLFLAEIALISPFWFMSFTCPLS